MKVFLIAVLCFHAMMAADKSMYIWKLAPDGLQTFLDENPQALVLFTRDDCTHCNSAISILQETANKVGRDYIHDADVLTVHVNLQAIEIKGQSISSFHLDGLPTFRLYYNGTHYDYSGPYEVEKLQSFVNVHHIPTLQLLQPSALDNFHTKNQFTVMYVYPNPGQVGDQIHDDPWARQYRRVAAYFLPRRDVTVMQSHYKDKLTQRWNIPSGVEFVVWSDWGKKIDFYRGEKTVKDVADFFQDLTYLPLQRFSQELYNQLFSRNKLPIVFYITASVTNPDFEQQLKDLAKPYQGRLVFVLVDQQGPEMTRLLKFFGVTEPTYPYIAIYDRLDQQRKYHQSVTQDISRIQEVVKEFTKNQMQPKFKSQEPPRQQPYANVTTLVGKTYGAFVHNAKRPVLINFHAPWCKFSQAFEPLYHELAAQYQREVVFATIDASENDVENLHIPDLPRLKLYMTKKYVDFEGEMTREAIEGFIQQHSTLREDL